MDIDPLSDHPPPRHALESDTEDDDVDLLVDRSSSSRRAVRVPDISFSSGVKEKVEKLFLVIGEVARHWKNVFELEGNAWKMISSINCDGMQVCD